MRMMRGSSDNKHNTFLDTLVRCIRMFAVQIEWDETRRYLYAKSSLLSFFQVNCVPTLLLNKRRQIFIFLSWITFYSALAMSDIMSLHVTVDGILFALFKFTRNNFNINIIFWFWTKVQVLHFELSVIKYKFTLLHTDHIMRIKVANYNYYFSQSTLCHCSN